MKRIYSEQIILGLFRINHGANGCPVRVLCTPGEDSRLLPSGAGPHPHLSPSTQNPFQMGSLTSTRHFCPCESSSRAFSPCATQGFIWLISLAACTDGKALFTLTHTMYFDHVLVSSLPSHEALFSFLLCPCLFHLFAWLPIFNQGCSHGRSHLSTDISPEARPLWIMIPAPVASISFLYLLREEWGLMGKAPQYS